MARHGGFAGGMRKHAKSGWKNGSGKSPKFRHAAKRNAEADTTKRQPLLKWPVGHPMAKRE